MCTLAELRGAGSGNPGAGHHPSSLPTRASSLRRCAHLRCPSICLCLVLLHRLLLGFRTSSPNYHNCNHNNHNSDFRHNCLFFLLFANTIGITCTSCSFFFRCCCFTFSAAYSSSINIAGAFPTGAATVCYLAWRWWPFSTSACAPACRLPAYRRTRKRPFITRCGTARRASAVHHVATFAAAVTCSALVPSRVEGGMVLPRNGNSRSTPVSMAVPTELLGPGLGGVPGISPAVQCSLVTRGGTRKKCSDEGVR